MSEEPFRDAADETGLPFGLTTEMARIIVANDSQDPIGLQFIPDARETLVLPQELSDPIGDYAHAPHKALVHRHRNRVLLKPTMVCAVYCRFCFRRDMVGPNGDTITQADVDAAVSYIATHQEISEVILTGGDPLVLSAKKLGALMQALQAIPHVKWIRLHSRLPMVAPQRVDEAMLAALAGPKPVMLAVHTNHAREFTANAKAALQRLSQAGIVLLGQSVLLKGINDTADALADLCETMMANRIKPYYLHHPDLTAGTSHFRFSLETGMDLMDALRQRVSGVCVPQYTLDIPGGVTKIAITRENVRTDPQTPGGYLLRDPSGQLHRYRDEIPA